MDNYSLADIRAATDHDNDSFDGQGGWFWIVVLFLFMFGFGGNGWGNRNDGALTRADLCQDFNFNDLQDDPEFFFSLARDFIEDADAKPLKVEKYFLN